MSRLSFRAKLTLIFLITAIIEGTLIGFFSYSHSEEIVVKNKKNEMADTINRIDININVKVRSVMEMIENAVSSQIVNDALARHILNLESAGNKAYLEEYCRNVMRAFGGASNIIILRSTDVVYAVDQPENASGDPSRISELYGMADKYPDKNIWTGVTDDLFRKPGEDPKQVVAVVRAITGREDRNVVGALAVELETDSFSNLLQGNPGIFEHPYTVIVDRNGNIICSNKRADTSLLSEIDSRFERGTRKFEIDWKDRRYYVCGQYNGLTGWKTYAVISTADLFPQARSLKNFILFFAGACTLGVSAVIALLSYAMTKPVNRLSDAMNSVQQGNFEIRLPNRRKDEIGRAVDSFNFMVSKINTLVNQVYQGKIAQKNAEIKALQAQINPHFLYNTLDTINWMVLEKGEEEISNVIVSLGDLMRYCIDEKDPFVTLEQEFQYVLSYLYIQKNRLEERLEYKVDLQESIKHIKVPKLILQPLAENAIKHGIEPYRKQGLIKIMAYDSKDRVYIHIEDNGPGMDKEQIRLLKQEADMEKEGHTSVGLKNVDKRIRLLYGDQYRLKIISVLGKGTLIIIRIPKKAWGEN